MNFKNIIINVFLCTCTVGQLNTGSIVAIVLGIVLTIVTIILLGYCIYVYGKRWGYEPVGGDNEGGDRNPNHGQGGNGGGNGHAN